MRVVKIVSALFAVMAFAAFAASSASAAETLWLMLPGASGTAISGSSGKATLQVKGSGTITCTSSKVKEGEIQGEQTLGLAWIIFIGCKAFGLAAETEGSGKETIIVHVEIHNCLIGPHVAGVLFKVLPVIILVPSVKLTINVQGSFVAELQSAKEGKFPLVIEQKEGVQSIEKCEGGEKLSLESKVDAAKAFVQSGEEAKEGTVSFAVEQELMV